MPARLPRGLSRTATGWRISLRLHGRLYQRRYPASLSQEDAEGKLLTARQRLGAGRSTTAAGTFADDVRRYLETYFPGETAGREERSRHLTLWTAALGADVWRDAVTREDVARVLHGWRGAGLSPDTCNKRRAALMACYHALDGRGAFNPVREVPKFRVAPPLPRGLPYARIQRALRRLPKCKTRARLKVIAYTGARPIQVRRLTPDDWDAKAGTLLLHATEKGQGTKPHRIPLSTQAQAAMREFDEMDAWGSFTLAPMGRMWKAAATAAGLPADVRVYDLRHSFGTAVYRATGDLRITKELLGHSSLQMTERYTLAAIPERQTLAIQAFNAAVAPPRRKGRKSPPKLPER